MICRVLLSALAMNVWASKSVHVVWKKYVRRPNAIALQLCAAQVDDEVVTCKLSGTVEHLLSLWIEITFDVAVELVGVLYKIK